MAVEQFLVRAITPEKYFLYIYINQNCVSIGRHQNPWRETNPSRMISHRTKLVRRISGGGAVYMDNGTLAYSFIGTEPLFSTNHQLLCIRRTLNSFHIKSEIRSRRSIFIGDYKVSGNAFYIRGRSRLHHGTLLVETNLKRLHESLQPEITHIETHAIPSERSPVTNIREHYPKATMRKIIGALIQTAGTYLGFNQIIEERELHLNSIELDRKIKSLSSFHWIYGLTPSFKYRGEQFFPGKWNNLSDISFLPEIK